ncbi:MAG TPA: hypothetical protein VKB83_02165 [Nitrosopumilaceae archaeon]|nr:hypothetical protein [Nitrosopumilaceae archaeon]
MSILSDRASLTSSFIRINSIEQFVYIHIYNVMILLSKMINNKNWRPDAKYLVAIVFAFVLLSMFGIFTYNVFADVSIRATSHTSGNHFDNTVLGTQHNPNAKHVKSPVHVPPSIIIEKYLQSKLCKNKCVHPQSP